MSDRIMNILTVARAAGGALLTAACIVWLAVAPDTAPSQEGVLAAFGGMLDQFGAVALAVIGAIGAGKALKDAVFTRQEQIVIEKRIQVLELSLESRRLELGIDGEIDAGP